MPIHFRIVQNNNDVIINKSNNIYQCKICCYKIWIRLILLFIKKIGHTLTAARHFSIFNSKTLNILIINVKLKFIRDDVYLNHNSSKCVCRLLRNSAFIKIAYQDLEFNTFVTERAAGVNNIERKRKWNSISIQISRNYMNPLCERGRFKHH